MSSPMALTSFKIVNPSFSGSIITSSDPSINQKRFYSLKKQLDAIGDKLDDLDDEFEHDYEAGNLSFKTYKSRERSIEKLEDQLDLAEDALENKFEIDD